MWAAGMETRSGTGLEHQEERPGRAEASSYLCGSRQDLGEHLLTRAQPRRGRTLGDKGLELDGGGGVGRWGRVELRGPDWRERR